MMFLFYKYYEFNTSDCNLYYHSFSSLLLKWNYHYYFLSVVFIHPNDRGKKPFLILLVRPSNTSFFSISLNHMTNKFIYVNENLYTSLRHNWIKATAFNTLRVHYHYYPYISFLSIISPESKIKISIIKITIFSPLKLNSWYYNLLFCVLCQCNKIYLTQLSASWPLQRIISFFFTFTLMSYYH